MKRAPDRLPIDIDRARELAQKGLTYKQIADSFGISHDTLLARRRENALLEDAIRQGHALGVATVANALYEMALNGNVAAAIFFRKNRAGWADRVEIDQEI